MKFCQGKTSAYITPLDENCSMDFCSQFRDYQDYKNRGIGFVIIQDGKVVSGASSYTTYNGSIEIEIGTLTNYRHKGLALICASKLILECLDHEIYPSWDVANLASVALAQKLGYKLNKQYSSYKIFSNNI